MVTAMGPLLASPHSYTPTPPASVSPPALARTCALTFLDGWCASLARVSDASLAHMPSKANRTGAFVQRGGEEDMDVDALAARVMIVFDGGHWSI